MPAAGHFVDNHRARSNATCVARSGTLNTKAAGSECTLIYSHTIHYRAMLTFCDSAPPSPHQGHEASTIDQPVLVAVACFPDRGHAIEELARTNEEFRLLGADLVDAEVAAVRREFHRPKTRDGNLDMLSTSLGGLSHRWILDVRRYDCGAPSFLGGLHCFPRCRRR